MKRFVVLCICDSHFGLLDELFLGYFTLLLCVLLLPADMRLLGNSAHLAEH